MKHSKLSIKILDLLPLLTRPVRSGLYNLTMPQYRILTYISQGNFLIGELAKKHGVSQPAMSKIVAGLIQRKILKITKAPHDRREKQLLLTPWGQRLLLKNKHSIEKKMTKILKNVTKKDQQIIEKSIIIFEKIFSS